MCHPKAVGRVSAALAAVVAASAVLKSEVDELDAAGGLCDGVRNNLIEVLGSSLSRVESVARRWDEITELSKAGDVAYGEVRFGYIDKNRPAPDGSGVVFGSRHEYDDDHPSAAMSALAAELGDSSPQVVFRPFGESSLERAIRYPLDFLFPDHLVNRPITPERHRIMRPALPGSSSRYLSMPFEPYDSGRNPFVDSDESEFVLISVLSMPIDTDVLDNIVDELAQEEEELERSMGENPHVQSGDGAS